MRSRQISTVTRSILAMTVLNSSTSGVVFAHKVLCLLGGVFGMFFFIRLVLLKPVVSAMFFIHLFNCVTFYSVLWGYVHGIPDAIEDFRKRLGMSARRGGTQYRYLRMVGGSLRPLGVQVGSFRSLERSSTLLFLEFASVAVANLLISFG